MDTETLYARLKPLVLTLKGDLESYYDCLERYVIANDCNDVIIRKQAEEARAVIWDALTSQERDFIWSIMRQNDAD